jgi:hypothetical protein
MAWALLFLDVALGIKYFLYLRTYAHLQHKEDKAAAAPPPRRGSVSARSRRGSVNLRRLSVYREDVDLRRVDLYCVHISADRLKERVEFLTLKYSGHAPMFQFVVWARQLALMGLVFFTDSVEPVSIDLSAHNATTAAQGSVGDQSIRVVRVQLLAAIFIVLYFWSLQMRFEPYQCTRPERPNCGTRVFMRVAVLNAR